MFEQLTKSIKVLLAVIGVSSPYPNVELQNASVYQDDGAVYVEFEALNLVNDSIKELMDNDIPITIKFDIVTSQNKDELFSESVYLNISLTNMEYYINQDEQSYDFSQLTNRLSEHELLLIPSYEEYPSQKYTSMIEILIYAADIPNLSDLWGNQPVIKLNYKL